MARGVAGECNYCPEPAAPELAPCELCGFHADWEAACNLVEDEYGGSIYGWAVVNQMHAWGWAPEAIDSRLAADRARDEAADRVTAFREAYARAREAGASQADVRDELERGIAVGQLSPEQALHIYDGVVDAQAAAGEVYVGLGDLDAGFDA